MKLSFTLHNTYTYKSRHLDPYVYVVMMDPFASLTTALDLLARGETTSVKLCSMYLDRIESVNPAINAVVVHRPREEVLTLAAAADDLFKTSTDKPPTDKPLLGIPITIKLHVDVANLTSCADGSNTTLPTRSGPIVNSLENAGAIVIGKTNVPVNCCDYQSFNKLFGVTRNPHDLALSPGGSSGGSAAAVAAGLASFCIGTDIGGSVRVPGSLCGVYAHKPTWGLLSKSGGGDRTSPSPPTDMSTTGPITRSPEDLEIVFRTILEGGGREEFALLRHAGVSAPRVTSLCGAKIALWADDAACPVDDQVSEAIKETVALLRGAGAIVEEMRPNVDGEFLLEVYRKAVASGKGGDCDDGTGHSTERKWIEMTHKEFLANEKSRAVVRRAFNDVFDRYDVILSPVFPCGAFPHDNEDGSNQPFWRETNRTLKIMRGGIATDLPYFRGCFWPAVANLTLLPATSFPIGGGEGLGLQIVGRELDDLTTINVVKLINKLARAQRSRIGRVDKPKHA